MSIGFSLMRRPAVGQKQIVKKNRTRGISIGPKSDFYPSCF